MNQKQSVKTKGHKVAQHIVKGIAHFTTKYDVSIQKMFNGHEYVYVQRAESDSLKDFLGVTLITTVQELALEVDARCYGVSVVDGRATIEVDCENTEETQS